MAVKKGDFIRIDYTESVDGKVIDATDKEIASAKGIFDEERQYGPRLIVVGSGQIVAGFEEDLVGKDIGYSGRVDVAPDEAFGGRDPKKVEIIPIARFKDEKPAVGMRVGMENRIGIITRIIGRRVSVDFNHPLAGKNVVYEYNILENIEDMEEKLRSLIKTFARFDLESKIVDDAATIYVPWEMSYYKEWLMIRRGLAEMIIMHLGLKEVDFVEKHTGGARVSAEVISPPAKEEPEEKMPEEAAGQETASVEADQGSKDISSA